MYKLYLTIYTSQRKLVERMKQPDKKLFEMGHILSGSRGISSEYWMTELTPLLRQLPLIYLCIPGTCKSHDYSVDRVFKNHTQHSSITSQLFNGIRYLNIDVVPVVKNKKVTWTCTPSLILMDVLRQVNLFALSHPDEVIFLQVNTRSFKCIEHILEFLHHLLFTCKENDGDWIKKYSIHSICKTKKNIILINNEFTANSNRVLTSCTKFINTDSIPKLDYYLNLAEASACTKMPEYAIKINLLTHDSGCANVFNTLFYNENRYRNAVSLAHEDMIQYVHSGANVENLNKIVVLCVEFECYIDLLYLCLQIMDFRFFR